MGTAGSASGAVGVLAHDRSNVTIRNGTISGFQFAIIANGDQVLTAVENCGAGRPNFAAREGKDLLANDRCRGIREAS